jgi:hypothetical protein
MAIRKKVKWKDRQHNGRQKERQTTQAIRKKGKWKDRQYNGHQKKGYMEGQTIQWPSERRINGRTNNTMAIKKKGKWKDRQHNGHQK